jgi:hypothetical protein
MVIGGVADQWVNDYGFSQRGKIAHFHILLTGTAGCWQASPIYCRPVEGPCMCGRSQFDAMFRITGLKTEIRDQEKNMDRPWHSDGEWKSGIPQSRFWRLDRHRFFPDL